MNIFLFFSHKACKNIYHRFLFLSVVYNWDKDFAIKQIKEVTEGLLKADGFRKVNPCDLTSEQMKDLGFRLWDEDNPIRLIPLWLFPFLVDEFECGSINDDEVRLTKLSEIDNDHRFGCLAHGVIPA